MHALILAAGKGTRMKDLTKDLPKPLLLYKGKSLLAHKLDALPDSVEDIIIVVGYLGEKIVSAIGNEYKGKKITYVWQKEFLGTAHALWEARSHINKKFLLLLGDDIYGKKDLEILSKHDHGVLVDKAVPGRGGGRCFLDADGNLISIIEDTEGKLSSPLVWTGVCVTTPLIFSVEPQQIPGRKEFGIGQTIVKLAPEQKINVVNATFWKQITSPEDLV